MMIKEIKSKLLKIQHMGFALLVAGVIVSCDKEGDLPTQEPEFTQEELAEMAAVEKFAAANSVYRALALIDELPDNWEGTTYTPEVGVPVNEAESDVRNVVSTGADHAKGYFLSIVPDHGLNGDTWSHEGVGTLTYRAVNKDDCYAVIDVNLVQMPGLRQLRFVPEAVVGENSFDGEPYYHVGDVVTDKKGIYWICVRPAGGPLKKDKAYFVSFDKSLIKTTTQNQTIYNESKGTLTKEKNTNLTGKWTYAKNLVEERIAIAAAHTFAMFFGSMKAYPPVPYQDFTEKAENLKFPVAKLLRYTSFGKDVDEEWKENTEVFKNVNAFAVAYGSCVKNEYPKVRQEKYLQPYLQLNQYDELLTGKIIEKVWKVWDGNSPYMFSLTTDYDPLSYGKFSDRRYYSSFTNAEPTEEKGYNKPFNILDYALDFNGTHFTSSNFHYAMNGSENALVLVMTQTSVKDNGKKHSGFERVEMDEECFEPDYWLSLDNTQRTMDNSLQPVENIYE
jgi:hypothetical protein